MIAVILAGGEGTRLRPLTLTRPKPFVPVGAKPCIEYVLESMRRAGVKDVVITTYYKPEDLIRHLRGGAALGLNLVYSVEDEALGTAGAVRKVSRLFRDTVIVASGDVFADVDVASLVKLHKDRGALASMALTEVEDPSQFGIVGTDDDGRIVRFKEKPKTKEETFSNLVNAGIYVLEPEVFDLVPEGRAFDFSKELFPKLLAEGRKLYGFRLEGTWIDIGRPEDLLTATAIVAERAGGALVDDTASVAASARVESSAVHARASVGENAVVERSLVLAGARVATEAVVTDSIVGEGAEVGAGAKVTNAVLGDGVVVQAGAVVDGVKLDPGQVVDARLETRAA